MRLSDLRERLNKYIQKTNPNIDMANNNNVSVVIHNYFEIRNETESISALNLFESIFFNFLKIIPNSNDRQIFFGRSDWTNFEKGLRSLRREVLILEKIISKIVIPDDPYLFDIELSSNIEKMSDLKNFNDLLNDLCKAIETIDINDKAICILKFQGFERGSNHIQFLIEAINNIDQDIVYAYLIKALNIAKEFLYLSGLWTTNKLVRAKAKSWEADANLKNAQANVIKIADEDKKNFIKSELENSKVCLTDEIREKATENLINKFIAILEKGNAITPSINAPKYIVQGNDNIFAINEEELKKILDERKKPKGIESSNQEDNDKKE